MSLILEVPGGERDYALQLVGHLKLSLHGMEERGQRESCAYVMCKNRDKKYKRDTLFLEAQLVFCTGRIV